jgi:two-component system, LytTR family, response regulator
MKIEGIGFNFCFMGYFMNECIKALIVDDEKFSRDCLKLQLKRCCKTIEIAAEAGSAVEARKLLQENNEIEMIFLDVSMPNEDGFQFLESIDCDKYQFIFVTAHDNFALRAFRASAVDYLQKPVDLLELQQAIDKLIKNKSERKSQSDLKSKNDNIRNLISNRDTRSAINRLCLPSMKGFTIIESKDILYLLADNNYTVFYTNDNSKIVVSKSIKEYADLLDPDVFFRNHKSSIINLKYLKGFSKVDGYYAIMADDNQISVSRRRLPEFLKAVEDFNCTIITT